MLKGSRARRPGTILLTAIALLAINGVALASHTFSDVSDGAFYHDAVDYIADRDVTSGCNSVPNGYCPGLNVTRGQMSVFLQKSMQTSAPTLLSSSSPGFCIPFPDPCPSTAINLDVPTRKCVTTDHTAEYAQAAIAQGSFQGRTSEDSAASVSGIVYSTDGGSTWAVMTPGSLFAGYRVIATHGSSTFSGNADIGQMLIPEGTTIRFAIQIDRDATFGGTTDLSDHFCQLTVQIFNQ